MFGKPFVKKKFTIEHRKKNNYRDSHLCNISLFFYLRALSYLLMCFPDIRKLLKSVFFGFLFDVTMCSKNRYVKHYNRPAKSWKMGVFGTLDRETSEWWDKKGCILG